MNRRDFIRIGATSAAGVAFLGGLPTKWYGLDADVLADPGTGGDRVVPTFCELCFWKCGVLAHVRDGRVTKITGNPKHPLSRGRICPRGAGGTGLLYDPDRLQKPLVRVGQRGQQTFEEVSWETALDEVAERFERIRQRHGASALALFYHGYGGNWMKHLFKAYGSPNIAAPSYAQCRGPRDVGFELTFGHPVGSPENTDMAHSRCLVLLGYHLGENMHNTQVQDFAAAIRSGADLIVVDPRFSVAASKARTWLPIKPGTDLALLLAWMNVIISEGRHDRDYVERYTYGFEQLREHVQSFTPEWAYARTGIEPHVIRDTARRMAAARPATLVHPGRHVTWYGNDTQRTRAIAMLNALLGSWGRRGGFYMPASMEIPKYTSPGYLPPERKAADRPQASDYPLGDNVLAQGLCDASITGLRDYDLKGWMVYGSNLPTTLPDPRKTYKAIQELDFLVSVDVLPSEICGWSDVVLPEATYLERCDELHAPGFREPFVAVRQEVVPPLYDSKPGWWIARELGTRLGLTAFFPWKDSMEYAKDRLHAAGHACDVLQRDGVIQGEQQPIYFEEGVAPEFWTDSGRIELYSNELAQHGFDPMPTWHDDELEEPPAGYYRLLFGRAPTHTFGRTTNNRLLSEVYKENEVWVNPSVARRWGLANGERVHLQNQDGVRSEFSAPVRVTSRIRPDAVFLVHGYGRNAMKLRFAYGRGIDTTGLITRYKVDPIMGGTGMNVNFVTFVKAALVSGEAAS
ncbi:MAG: molybdopterin-dependent oxidoreductase [Candidatus Latescibacterota bacterium]|nr:MAG: molybdopterin-dependent oxidoreductase [Candidatus Latescibacterota bacterium]